MNRNQLRTLNKHSYSLARSRAKRSHYCCCGKYLTIITPMFETIKRHVLTWNMTPTTTTTSVAGGEYSIDERLLAHLHYWAISDHYSPIYRLHHSGCRVVDTRSIAWRWGITGHYSKKVSSQGYIGSTISYQTSLHQI